MSTLVVLPPALEDVLRCLPALDALAAGGRRLLALAEPEVTALLPLTAAAPGPMPRLPALASTRVVLRVTQCDEAVVLGERLEDRWLAYSAGIPLRWGYRSLAGGVFLNRRVRRPPRRTRQQRPASEDFRELLDAMQVPWGSSVPRLRIGEEERDEARQRLERARIRREDDQPLVGIYPGMAGGGSDRPWPRPRFEELVRQLRRRHPQVRFVILATTEDLWTSVRVHEETGKIHPVIGPDLEVDALASLLAELDLVIAVESSMLDLAAAAGTRTLGLHLRNPRRWGPPGEGHQALDAGQAGSIRAIGLSRVMEAAAALLGGKSTSWSA